MKNMKTGDLVQLLDTGIQYTVEQLYTVSWGSLGTEDWAVLIAEDGQIARWKQCQLRKP